MAGRGKGWLRSQEDLLEDQGWWQGWTPPRLPQAFGSSAGVVAGDAATGVDGQFAPVGARRLRSSFWTNLGFRDLRLALGVSGFPSPVKVWCRKKLNEPYCKDFALKQKIFNTLGLSCWERSFPSVAVHVTAEGFGSAGVSLGVPQHGEERDQAPGVRGTSCRTSSSLGWDAHGYGSHPAVPPRAQTLGGGKRHVNVGYAPSEI